MKYIQKGSQPRSYTTWRGVVRGTDQEKYKGGSFQNPEKEDVKKSLLDEQGYICAYTQRRIGLKSSHIEHLKPRHQCVTDIAGGSGGPSDLDYENFLACYPKESANKEFKYGAPLKDKWWEDDGDLFVSPLWPACESKFLYSIDGSIAPINDDEAAIKTIEVLGLNHTTLVADRRGAIESYIYGPDFASPLSPKKTTTALASITDRLKDGKFVAFCLPIADALEQHQESLKKHSAKRKFAAKSKRSNKK